MSPSNLLFDVKHRLEALLLRLVFFVFRVMPLDIASATGAALGRVIGPCLRAHRTALDNLAQVFPEKSAQERAAIAKAMWEHLGRTSAEMAHLPKTEITRRITVIGAEHMLAHKGRNIFFFSGHIGNWELLPYTAESYGIPITLAYRTANNPYVDRIICEIRASRASGMFPKGSQGAVKLVRALKEGLSPAMLVDQKMNTGIAVPFFGRDAMSAPAIAQMALRYNAPIVPARVVRTKGAHFDVHIEPALEYAKTGDDEKDILAIMTLINQTLERWIREHPEQWFWVHRRWPKEDEQIIG